MTRTDASNRFSARSGATLLAAARPLGRAALSCGLAGALTMGAAAAAFAGEHPTAADGAGSNGRAVGQERQAAAGRGQDSSKGAATSARPTSATTEPRQKTPPAKTTSHQGQAQQPVKPAHTASQKEAAAKPSASHETGQDPAGNNGTVKVDGAAWDARVDNEPHPSCAFRVTFFGFDEGQTADITITGIAPTGGGVLLHETAVPTSDDSAGGAANDADGATRVYTADDLGLSAVTPHPKQGYHLKVAVDSLEAPGGAKQKVLWLEPCDDQQGQAPVTQPETGEPSGGPQAPSAPAAGAQPEAPAISEAPGLSDAGVRPASPSEAAYVEPAAPAGVRPFDAGERSSSVTAPSPTAHASALPTGLAFTGAGGLGLLALTGAGAAAAGLGLQVARRRAGAQASTAQAD